jgi:hypothetical protein
LLFSAATFTSAALLFLVEPMVAKMALPYFGGSPAVWNTCMLFFQAALLAGYLYAHLATTWLAPRLQVLLQAVLLLLPVVSLPIALSKAWVPSGGEPPIAWVLGGVTASAGLPFLLVSTSGPLLQRWYGSLAGGRDPYFLYATGNAGSLLALLAYPTLVEPNLTLSQQSGLWALAYGVLVALIFLCGAAVLRRPAPAAKVLPAAADKAVPPVPWAQRLHWVALAAVPSSLMRGVTLVLSTDLPPVPLLWVIPLALYLLSFILTFAGLPRWVFWVTVGLLPVVLLGQALLAFATEGLPLWKQLGVHLGTLFVVAMVCHGELARRRPATRRLTEFYLWLAVGGVLGGVFNGLLAPLLFNSAAEFPLALVAAGLLCPVPWAATQRWPRLLPGALLGGLVGLCFVVRSLRGDPSTEVLCQERSFFGISKVERGTKKNVHWLIHGRVEHGGQAFSDDPKKKFAPFLYYDPAGPVGQLFVHLLQTGQRPPVAVVGLGAGSLAYYGQKGQEFRFFEIDPVVRRIAEDPRYFTFLADSRADCRVVLGDARLTLAREPAGHYGVLVIDAFAGDAVPVHLLTVEAVDLYLEKLAEDGVLALHISNQYLELEPVVAAAARAKGLVGLSRRERGADLTEAEWRRGRRPSHWILLARYRGPLEPFANDPRWQALSGRPTDKPWKDDYSNIFGALR